jgi:hypothetical protein
LRIIFRNTWHQHRDARTTRFRRRIDLFVRAKITLQTDAPTAPRTPRLVTIANAPLVEAGCRDKNMTSDKKKEENLGREILRRHRLEAASEFSFAAQVILAARPSVSTTNDGTDAMVICLDRRAELTDGTTDPFNLRAYIYGVSNLIRYNQGD